ncbi:acyl-ACP thioesterase [Spirochaetia bacterium]|nr:acyl-ACP thioesterase [Spirochaetia bacterium]
MDIWQESVTVRFGDVDRSDRLTVAAASGYFQEAAIDHAQDLGVGRDALLETHQGWILSRFSVVMDIRPLSRSKIIVRTWPCGSRGPFAMRDYDIRDAENRILARGRSAWIIIDVEKRAALRPEPVLSRMPGNESMDSPLPDGAQGIKFHEPLTLAGTRQAAYSDIDYYGHMNNVRYIQWIADSTDPAVLEQAEPVRVDINYINEIKAGEHIELWMNKLPENRILYEGRREEQVLFRAEIHC